MRETLVLCWGNPARQDDGIGPAAAERLAAMSLPGVHVDSDYQLQIEDAAELARYARVVFVDADRSGPAPFHFERQLAGRYALGFSSHSVTPGALLGLARELFDAEPEAWLLGIRGYDFDDFREGLSDRARANLTSALSFLQQKLSNDASQHNCVASTTQSEDKGDSWPKTNA